MSRILLRIEGRHALSLEGSVPGFHVQTLCRRRAARTTEVLYVMFIRGLNGGPDVGLNGGPLCAAKPKVRHARIPHAVLVDSRVSHIAVRVYCFLAECVWQGTSTRMGQRWIAKNCQMARSSVQVAIDELIAAGHVNVPFTGKNRAVYHLTSPLFGQKQAAGIAEVASGPSGGKRLVSAPRRKTA